MTPHPLPSEYASLPERQALQQGARERILVIKLGALGDFVQALAPIHAIRRHHGAAHLTLLTTRPYDELARASGWFDEVWVDERPQWWQLGGLLALRRRLRGGRFDRIYDLQTSDRRSAYYRLMGRPHPEWSGIAAGCSHPHINAARDAMHTMDRQAQQLKAAGIPAVPPADLDWLDADIGRFGLKPGFVLLVPGGAAHRPEKRWPPARYGTLARELISIGRQPVLIGAAAEADIIAEIVSRCRAAVDLSGKTSLLDIAGLARRASGAVGNDTGPMHIAAAVGCPSAVLFSAASDPALCAPRGDAVRVLRREPLAGFSVAEVEAALRLR